MIHLSQLVLHLLQHFVVVLIFFEVAHVFLYQLRSRLTATVRRALAAETHFYFYMKLNY